MAREGSPVGKIPPMPPPDSRRRPVVTLVAIGALVAIVVGLWAIELERPPAPTAMRQLLPTYAGPESALSIVRVPGRDVVVINRGMGDQVRQGTMFHVYDKQAGLPAAQPADSHSGAKAVVQVVRVGPGFSECRVVQRAPGMAVVQGDLLVEAPAGAGPPPAQPAHSGQVPPVPTSAPAPAGTNPGRS